MRSTTSTAPRPPHHRVSGLVQRVFDKIFTVTEALRIDVIGAKAEPVGNSGWTLGNVVPEFKEQRALEQKVRRVTGCLQTIQQPFQSVMRECEIEVLLRGVGAIFKAGANRCRGSCS